MSFLITTKVKLQQGDDCFGCVYLKRLMRQGIMAWYCTCRGTFFFDTEEREVLCFDSGGIIIVKDEENV